MGWPAVELMFWIIVLIFLDDLVVAVVSSKPQYFFWSLLAYDFFPVSLRKREAIRWEWPQMSTPNSPHDCIYHYLSCLPSNLSETKGLCFHLSPSSILYHPLSSAHKHHLTSSLLYQHFFPFLLDHFHLHTTLLQFHPFLKQKKTTTTKNKTPSVDLTYTILWLLPYSSIPLYRKCLKRVLFIHHFLLFFSLASFAHQVSSLPLNEIALFKVTNKFWALSSWMKLRHLT